MKKIEELLDDPILAEFAKLKAKLDTANSALAEVTAERDGAEKVLVLVRRRILNNEWSPSLVRDLTMFLFNKGIIDAHGNPVGATNQDIVIERIVDEAKGESPQEADDDRREK